MHMTSLMGYARTMLHGGEYRPEPVETFADEITRFHAMLGSLRDDFADASLKARITDKQFLQGPLSDAMTKDRLITAPEGTTLDEAERRDELERMLGGREFLSALQ